MGEENVITWVTADAFVPGVLVGAPGASYTMYWASLAAFNNTYYKPNAPRDITVVEWSHVFEAPPQQPPARQTRERGCFE